MAKKKTTILLTDEDIARVERIKKIAGLNLGAMIRLGLQLVERMLARELYDPQE